MRVFSFSAFCGGFKDACICIRVECRACEESNAFRLCNCVGKAENYIRHSIVTVMEHN